MGAKTLTLSCYPFPYNEIIAWNKVYKFKMADFRERDHYGLLDFLLSLYLHKSKIHNFFFWHFPVSEWHSVMNEMTYTSLQELLNILKSYLYETL